MINIIFKFKRMNIAIIIFIIFACVFSVLFSFDKYKNTKTGLMLRFCWFGIVFGSFFFFSHDFTTTQNLFMAFVCGGGLVYFLYNFKKMVKN